MANAREDQFLGALLGMAIGDALGMPVRGMSRADLIATHGKLTTYLPGRTADGAEIGRGEFTEESEITLCIVESLTANGGVVDVDNIGARLTYLARGESKRWMSPDTLAALETADETLNFQVPVNEDAPATGEVASRGVAIGLLHAIGTLDDAAFRADAEAVTRLTHGSPAAIAAATAVAYAVRLATRDETPRRNWAAAVAAFLQTGELAERLLLADELLQAGTPVDEAIAHLGTGEAAAESVPAAMLAALTAATFAEAVLTAVNAGGATDTIGAIAGALAGAAGGVNDIPQPFIDDLEGRIYVSLAAPWFFRAVLLKSGEVIDLRRREPPRPSMPPRI
ncbi:MAG: ADP-ribosylglycohydrolase family protein [Chloroflexota bacterium]|nr:ADP-ribosylglycohydrolase family protein [Chloroflexota bacterium]